MIFDCNLCCAVAEIQELQGEMPLQLGGEGLWAGVLSSGRCVLRASAPTKEEDNVQSPGTSGDIMLAFGAFTLAPVTPCHLLCLRLTGFAVQQFLRGLPAPRFSAGVTCPGAAELLTRLCAAPAHDLGGETSPTAYALLCALAKADEEVRALSPLVAAALAAIRDNYMALYGVEELSEQLGVSKAHLIRVFSAEMGTPPGRYLTRTRLESAKLLLLDREYTLEMIATLCGFSGANYFCRVFKRETGLTPDAWRRSATPPPTVPALPSHRGEIFV